jgi:hypothetical protein
MKRETDINSFLMCVQHLSCISIETINKLSIKFGIEPDSLSALICLYGGEL